MTNYGIADEHGTDYTVGLQGEVVARRTAQRLANQHAKPVYLYEVGADGEPEEVEPETITYGYVEHGEQRSAEHACTTEQAVAAAVAHLDAIGHGCGYAYRAEETGCWYQVSTDDMTELGAAILAGRASEAYSLWCAGCGEEIDDPTAPSRKVLLRVGAVGQSFGTVGVIHDVTTGERLYEGPTRPYGFTTAAMADVAAVAKERGYIVLTDEEAIECGIDPQTGDRFADEG